MRKTARKLLSLLIVLAFALSVLPLGGVPVTAAGTISLNAMEIAYTQNFDTLAISGTADASTLPAGWDLFESGTGANTTYAAGDGSGNGGNTYSFGVSGNSDRAFGGLLSGSVTPIIGAQLTNNTGSSILSLSISYTGEQWRLGALNRTDQLNFQYSTDATSLNSGTWIDVDALDFVAPTQTGTAGMLNGNLAANQTAISAIFSGMNIPHGASFWIRWTDFNATSSDDGLAVDNFSLTAMSTVPDVAPKVSETSPKNGDVDVFIDAPITVTFSEPVNVADNWFTFTCETGIAPTLTANAGPAATFTITHTEDFPQTTSCTFAIPDPTKVTDVDGSPNALAAPFTASFTVETYVDLCSMDFTPIYTIQGTGASTAFSGQQVHIEGVVVGDFEDAQSNLKGFYLQDSTGDGDANTSDGIFVYNNNTEDRVNVGERVHVIGTAGESFAQTQISSVTDWQVCGVDQPVLPLDVTMPFADETFLERLEGMLVRFPQNLVIAEYFEYDRYGEIVLALPLDGETRPYTGTAIDEPGPAAVERATANSLRRITLDDNNSKQNPDVLRHPNGLPFSLENRFRGGDTVGNTVGVLGYGFSKYRIFPTGPAEYTSVNPRSAAPEEVGGEIRVSAMNTLNYFVTPDYPSGALDNKCGPANNQECRGWDSDEPNELSRQRAKLIEALNGLDADVIGLNELENSTGVEPLADIITGLPGYAYIETGTIGTDAIKVGMIYRTSAVTPVGSYKTIDSTVDPRFLETKNRPSLAQTFQVNATGEKFTVVVNHFKSKGSDCNSIGDPDTGDGQGNCSQTRANAAAALVDWLATDPTGSGDPDFIILGDLNSYAMEDTIDAIKAGADDTVDTDDDYTNLIAKYQGTHAYSYTFDGQAGYLDHALASASMAAQVTGATEWHINSDEPDILDYDTTFKPTAQEALYEPNQYRTSDHDPVIVGLHLGPIPVNNAPVALDDSYETDEDDGLTVDAPGVLANDTDDDGDPITASVETQPDHGSVQMEASGSFTYTPDADFNGTDTFTYTVSDGELTGTATVTIEVEPVNDAPVAVDDSYEMDEDTELTVLAPGLLVNDSDVDGDTLMLAAISGPQHGNIWLNANGRIDYIPDADFHGTETLTYTILDGGLTASATVTIAVKAVNDAPVAVDDTYETNEDTDLVIPAPGVLSNDTDVDGDPLTAQENPGPQHGTLSMTPDGGFLYTPDTNFHGTDSFTYEVSDGEQSDTGTVTITVKAVDDGYYAVITKNKFFPEEGELVTFTANLVNLDTEEPVEFSDGTVFDWFFETGHTGSGEVKQYAFTDEDTYVVTLDVDDPVYGTFTATTTVPVKNANPTIAPIAPITIGQRGLVEKAGTFTDPGQDEQFTATVDYGDGTGVQPLALGDGTFNLSHQYITAGDFTITIVLDDGDGGEDTLTIAVTVEGRQIFFLPYMQN